MNLYLIRQLLNTGKLTMEDIDRLHQQGYAVICGDGQAQHIIPEPLS